MSCLYEDILLLFLPFQLLMLKKQKEANKDLFEAVGMLDALVTKYYKEDSRRYYSQELLDQMRGGEGEKENMHAW